jgi:hypothetical protein
VAHLDLAMTNEFDFDGNLLASIGEPGVWFAVPLKNGDLLTVSNQNIVKERAVLKGDMVVSLSQRYLIYLNRPAECSPPV